MKDIQSLPDTRRINIRKVGVKNVTYPITVKDRAQQTQQTVAALNMYVNLPHEFKGTHMSRFVEILNTFHGEFTLATLRAILEEMKQRLDAEAAHLECSFAYFVPSIQDKKGKQQSARMDQYTCCVKSSLEHDFTMLLEVGIPVQALPMGEHRTPPSHGGLWGNVTIQVRMQKFLWIEELIELVEQGIDRVREEACSATDICQQVGLVLGDHPALDWYRVLVKNISPGHTCFVSTEGGSADWSSSAFP